MMNRLTKATVCLVLGGLTACAAELDDTNEIDLKQLPSDHEHCSPLEGELVEHACLHAHHGPFRDVGAARLDAAGLPATSNVNNPHTTYTVHLASVGDGYGGKVSFLSRSAGDRVFYLDGEADLSVTDSHGHALHSELSGPVSDDACDRFAMGVVFGLERGCYVVEIRSAQPHVALTIEALDEECEEHEEHGFSDMTGHPAAHEVEDLAEHGIIAGFSDNTFRPDETVTRAQFAAIIRQAFLDGREARPSFRDVRGHWAALAIGAVEEAGFMSGYPDRTFRPEQPVTREQALVTLASGLEMSGGRAEDLAEFPDATRTSDWALEGVESAARAGLLSNADLHQGRLRPTQPATRAEVASFVFHALH